MATHPVRPTQITGGGLCGGDVLPMDNAGGDGGDDDTAGIARDVVREASRRRAREDEELLDEVFAEEIEERPVMEYDEYHGTAGDVQG